LGGVGSTIEERRSMSESSYPTEIPEQIREVLGGLRQQWLEGEGVKNELLEANDISAEEARRRDQLFAQIFEKIGVAEEAEELNRLREARRARIKEVVDKHFPR
jgi:hypothetical protein